MGIINILIDCNVEFMKKLKKKQAQVKELKTSHNLRILSKHTILEYSLIESDYLPKYYNGLLKFLEVITIQY